MIRTTATFQTNIPDDTIENEDRIIKFGGCAVATAIGEMLREQGFEVEEPDYAEEHGWDFSARIVREKIKTKLWFQITLADDVILISEDSTFTIFGKTDPSMLGRTLVRLNEQLDADGRFSDIMWFTQAGLDKRQGGSSNPIG